MIEVTQTRLGPTYGNCYAACIASIFELNLEKLPRLPEDDSLILAKYPITEHNTINDSRNEWWWGMWGTWFSDNNLVRITIDYDKISRWERSTYHTYHILNGPSPRDREREEGRSGMMHSVVGKRGLVWFDPHPSRSGLLALDTLELIVPRHPEKPILEAYRSVA